MKQIVCISTKSWYPVPTRKQQVMARIPDSEILYFDPSVSFLAPLKDKSTFKNLFLSLKPGVKPKENITVYTLPPIIPFYNRFRFINKLNQKRIARYINKKIKIHNFDKPLVWAYSPSTCDAIDLINHNGVVYDCVDRHSAYGGQMNPKLVDEMELLLAKKCDVVFATAKSLAERIKAVNQNTYFIPNGANYERFSLASEPQPVPDDMKNIKHPVFGFVGLLQECINYRYIEKAAASKPDWSFVFVGDTLPGVNIKKLCELPNVYLLGLKPNEKVPEYIAQFDVCLNLFDNSQLSKDVSPLKFYEYLATGKPVVSTPRPDQVLQYHSIIQIANDADAFIDSCLEALSDNSPERNALRMKEGKNSSWDARVKEMLDILEEHKVF